jgi:O-antigen/teichoic acid export membrane protein
MYNNYLLTSENINKMQRLNLWRLVSVNILSICCLYFFNFDKAFIRFSASYFIEIIIITTCVVPYIFRIKVPFNWHIVKKTFFLGLPLLFNALIGILVNFGDKYFLEKYGTFKELSVYFLAFSFASILSFIYASFQNIYMPVFLKETNIETNIRQSKKIARIFILAFIALSILIILGLKFLLLFNVIPSKYSNVIPLLPIVLTTQIIISLTSFVGIFIVYFEKTLLITLVGIFVGIICILLNILLIPKYKQYGAATAALIVNALYLIFYIMIVKAQIKKNEAVII